MFQLPFDLFVLILEYLEPAFILSLRLVNTTWRDAVDGEDVSKWFLYHARFTFRGKALRQYREAMNSSDSYQNIMSRLCFRLRRLHHDGPVYRYSIPLAPERKLCYGNNFVAPETQDGEAINVVNAETRELLYSISLQSILGSTFDLGEVIRMEIKSSVLSVSVNEVPANQTLNGTDQGFNFILFLRLYPDCIPIVFDCCSNFHADEDVSPVRDSTLTAVTTTMHTSPSYTLRRIK